MRRFYTPLLTLLALLCMQAPAAWSQMNYYFMESTGEPLTLGAPTILTQGNGPGTSRQNYVYGITIPFMFRFNGTDYNQFTVSTNGVVYFGNSTTYDANNNLRGGSLPLLAPFWDALRPGGGGQGCIAPLTQVGITGAAPNRVFVIDFKDYSLSSYRYYRTLEALTFQVRLYEGSNKIEFWYGRMSNCGQCPGYNTCFATSASIGIAANSSNFISVSIEGGQAVSSTTTANDNVNIDGGVIKPGTLFTFAECTPVITGRIGEGNGGTPNAANGDVFFQGTNTQLGETSDFKPIAVAMAAVACQSNYSMTISGPDAADYYFGTPGTQTISGSLAGGVIQIPTITFRPSSTGTRTATLTVTVASTTRTYTLAAYAPFVSYTGHVDEGGTTMMKSGDILLVGKRVDRRNSDTYEPFTLTNVSTTTVPVSYDIIGGFGQYSITPGGPLGPGESVTPTITFNAIGFGPQNATLEVTAGTEVRTFTLRAISAAPGGEFRTATSVVDTSSSLFNNVYGCTGGNGETIEIQMVNTGYGPFTITGTEFYRIDTAIGAGSPPFRFLRDENGNLIPSSDYVLSLDENGTAFQPFTLSEGESRTLYLRFISQIPGKRYARAYFYTNSENTAAPDTNGVMREGILAFDVFGRGSGSRLSDRIEGGLPRAVVFPSAKLGTSSESTLKIVNTGTCPLSVSMKDLAITAGDVDEFTIIDTPGDGLIGPGETEEVRIRFTPRQAGSRRASLRLVTNDSTIQIPGITERGTYYVDLFGGGGTDLYVNGYNFGQGLINGTGADQKRGIVRIVNTLSAPVTVNTITIEGSNSGEFSEDANNAWPTLPLVLQPGQEVTLGVVFAPTGDVGAREAEIKLELAGGVTVTAPLTGEAGTRMASAAPQTIQFPMTTFGKFQRRMVSVTNTGTMPLMLQQPTLSGPDAAQFTVSTMARLELAPGQTEQVEVTFTPAGTGVASATLEFDGNMTNGPVSVQLGGASRTQNPNDPSIAVPGRTGVLEDGVNMADGLENLSLSSVGVVSASNGMTLSQSAPNPAQHSVEIRYTLAKSSEVALVLYDAQGRELRVLDAGMRNAGERVLSISVNDLANGAYFYQLRADGQILTRSMTVAK